MSKIDALADLAAERSILCTIVKNGKDALLDASSVLQPEDFHLKLNKDIFACLVSLEEEGLQIFDMESIKLKINGLDLSYILENKEYIQYLEMLFEGYHETKNLNMFIYQVKKYSVTRGLYKNYTNAIDYLGSLKGDEKLSEIISSAESEVTKYIGQDEGSEITTFSDNIDSYIEEMINAEPVDQVGLPTGLNRYDEAIGGGLRPGTVNVVGARPKVGKSFISMNVAINVAKQGIPVLYLDTELTSEYQKNRLICIESGCPLYDFERSKFKNNEDLVAAVRMSKAKISGMPLYHKEVGGMEYSEIINLCRRWITKEIGFDNKGHANPCLIVYDYLKLTGMSSLGSNIPEHIALGFMLTELHNFAVKYNIPIFSLVQLNRDGIEEEDSAVIAGSDRILWLCSSFSILKNKTENDISLGCGYEHGNKKLIVVETRQGSGLEVPGDYINLKCSLRPNISKNEACGKIVEGNFASVISGGYGKVNDKSQRSNSDDNKDSTGKAQLSS